MGTVTISITFHMQFEFTRLAISLSNKYIVNNITIAILLYGHLCLSIPCGFPTYTGSLPSPENVTFSA